MAGASGIFSGTFRYISKFWAEKYDRSANPIQKDFSAFGLSECTCTWGNEGQKLPTLF